MTLANQLAVPVHSTQALSRPLSDEERQEIWGHRGGSVSTEELEELERILQSGDDESRALAEAYLCVLIFKAMSERMLEPGHGYGSHFADSLSEAVAGFNRYIR